MKERLLQALRRRAHSFAIFLLAAVPFVWLAGAAQSPPPGWAAYHSTGKLLVQHPAGWRVQDLGDGAFIAYLPGAGSVAQALVYVKPQRFSAQRGVDDVLGLLPREETALFPGAVVRRANVLGPDELPPAMQGVVGELAFAVGGQPFKGTALVWRRGATGSLAVMSATPAAWKAQAGTMHQILQNFRYLSNAPAPAQRGVATPTDMVIWRDPAEGAFTMPVPRNWQVVGGMVRPNPFVYKPDVVVSSPDGAIQLRVGDASIPNFSEPYLVPGVGQMPEGTVASGQMVLMRYLPGHLFLTHLYLPNRFGAMAAAQAQAQALPALAARAFQQRPPAPPVQGRADAGEVSFNLQTPAGPRRAWFAVVTRREAAPGITAAWFVEDLFGLICAPEQEALARTVLVAMIQGFRWDQRWAESQSRANAAIGLGVIDHNQHMNELWAQAAAARSAGMEAAQAPLSRSLRGEVDLTDDQTGQRIRVQGNGSQDYYREQRTGRIVGSDATDLSPFEYRLLMPAR